MVRVTIESFGYLHGDAPEADITYNLRKHFRDPHVNPELRFMTADDKPVRDAVMATSGIRALVESAVRAAEAFASGPSADDITIAVGCAGGRHRAPVVARAIAERLNAPDYVAIIVHRDLNKPVVLR